MSPFLEMLRFTLGPFATNAFVIVGPSGHRAMCVDPGIGSEVVLGAMEERGLSLEVIVNTHGHLDHAAGNRMLRSATGARLAIHPADAPMLSRLSVQAAVFGLEVANSPEPDLELREGEPLIFDGLAFEVIHTPGHSPGGVCLRLGPQAWVGDTLFRGSVGRSDLPGGSWPSLVRSIREKLFLLPAETRCHPGHGPDTTIAEERRGNPFVSDRAIGATAQEPE